MVGEIKIKDVHKSFPNTEPGKEDIVALNGINLDIKPGSFVSLIVRNREATEDLLFRDRIFSLGLQSRTI